MFEGEFLPPHQLIQRATDQLEAAVNVEQAARNSGKDIIQQLLKTWKAPPLGTTKCNWDAAIDSRGKRMGVGVSSETIWERC